GGRGPVRAARPRRRRADRAGRWRRAHPRLSHPRCGNYPRRLRSGDRTDFPFGVRGPESADPLFQECRDGWRLVAGRRVRRRAPEPRRQAELDMSDTTTDRRIIRRTRGSSHGPITRLVSPSDLGLTLKPFVFLDLFEAEGGLMDMP